MRLKLDQCFGNPTMRLICSILSLHEAKQDEGETWTIATLDELKCALDLMVKRLGIIGKRAERMP